MEIFMEMEDEMMDIVVEILNQWWEKKQVPEELMQFRVVLIFKKGDRRLLSNYRPISLMNSMYKIFAAVLQRRISQGIERHLQRTQSGFRQQKRTAHAICIIRQTINLGERADRQVALVLLDWQKAFHKIPQKGMLRAMERMGIDTHLIDLTRSMYKNLSFVVEVEGFESGWYQQGAGILQGSTLSAYLFLIVMTVIFHDAHNK